MPSANGQVSEVPVTLTIGNAELPTQLTRQKSWRPQALEQIAQLSDGRSRKAWGQKSGLLVYRLKFEAPEAPQSSDY